MPTITVVPIASPVNLQAGKYTQIFNNNAVNTVSSTLNARMVSQDITVDKTVTMFIVPAAVVASEAAKPAGTGYTNGGVVAPPLEHLMIPPNTKLGPNGIPSGVYEDTGLVLQAGDTVVCFTPDGGVTARVHGFQRQSV